eukprot:15364743-Ditylum_brightwellii.AAC.1
MVKYDWHNALCNLGRIPTDMTLEDLADCFKRIELLDIKHKVISNSKPQIQRKRLACEHMNVEDLHASNLKLSKKQKKYKRKGKCRSTYASESSDSDSYSS